MLVSAAVVAAAAPPQLTSSWLDEPIGYVLTTRGAAWPQEPPVVARCANCGRGGLLVDDTGLCIPCDSLFYPSSRLG